MNELKGNTDLSQIQAKYRLYLRETESEWMNKSMVTKQKLLVARGNKYLSNKKNWVAMGT